jgi:hypothetical protein
VEEEQRLREQFREQYLNADKRVSIALSEKEDLAINIEQVRGSNTIGVFVFQLERVRRQLETDLLEAREYGNAIASQNSMLTTAKSKFEHDFVVTKVLVYFTFSPSTSVFRQHWAKQSRSFADSTRKSKSRRAMLVDWRKNFEQSRNTRCIWIAFESRWRCN